MKTLLERMNEAAEQAFLACGYDGSRGRVQQSNRPDLCEYQCNGAMADGRQLQK